MASVLERQRQAESPPAPPLQSGDRLDQPTFHQRYAGMPKDFRAELIGGLVFVSSPATNQHAESHGLAITWLGVYQGNTPGTRMMDNGTVILDESNEPQPDGVLRIDEACGGGSRVDGKGYVRGVPELHVEVAYSSEAIDLHLKREEYERAGVAEYLVVLVGENTIRGFRWDQTGYVDFPPDEDGVWRSQAFPGLWLNVQAMALQDTPGVLKTLDEGLNTSEHQAFVQRLAAAKG